MEKKTLGSFISQLRKSSGMTQRELADRLNVSDKSVSRWERDECAPDLSLIPLIAEIFGVTCDELLKGERKKGEEANVSKEAERGEKELKLLLKATLTKYINNTYIAVGVSILGFIAALISNLAFLKASLGFFIGEIFFLFSIILQIIFINKAFSIVDDVDDTSSSFKRKIITNGERSVGVTIVLVGFTFPLLFVDAYLGLSLKSMTVFGTIGALSFILLYLVVLYFLNAHFVRNNMLVLSERESEVYWSNHKKKRNYGIVLVSLLLVTFIIHHFSTSIWGPYTIMKGTVFNDYDSFVEFMEEDIPSTREWNVAIAPEAEIESSAIYYDRYGNEITKEEAITRRLEDRNGNVVCKYLDNNKSVVSIQYSPKDGTILPIKVFTERDLKVAKAKVSQRNVLFGILYVLISLSIVVIYYIKRDKLS